MIINGVEYLDPYKKNETDQVFWLTKREEIIGEFLFSFDLSNVFNIYLDYPQRLSIKEKEIFDKENPFWVEYFSIT